MVKYRRFEAIVDRLEGKGMKKLEERNYYHFVDIARLVSALAIILIHTTTAVLYLYDKVDLGGWVVAVIFNSATRWGTPVFIMISGALLLRSRSADKALVFYKKRASKILIPILFWGVFYFWLGVWINGSEMSVMAFLNLMWMGGTYYHLYFLFLISGLYLITPILKLGIKRNWNNKFDMVLLFFLAGGVIYTYLSTWGYVKESKNIVTMFVPYIGYYLAGYYLGDLRMSKKIKPYLWVVIELMLVITFLGTLWLVPIYGFSSKGMYFLHRLNINTMIVALIIFWSLTKIKFENFLDKSREIKVRYLASLSMGVYLIHPAVLEIFQKGNGFADLLKSNPVLWMGLALVGTVGLSFGLVAGIKKVPLLKRIV